MRLESSDGPVVELRPLRYQFPAMTPNSDSWDWDANWLVIAGTVHESGRSWSFQDPCLTTREARELGRWLSVVAEGRLLPSESDLMWFTEPNLSFRLTASHRDQRSLVAHFAQESSPPAAGEDLRYGEGLGVPLSLTRDELRAAAADRDEQLRAFPER